jgi:hypothetical protein
MPALHAALLMSAFALTSITADAQTSTRMRGTIAAFDGTVLSVKSREGKELKITLADRTTITGYSTLRLADIKPGMAVGAGAVKREDGVLVAR